MSQHERSKEGWGGSSEVLGLPRTCETWVPSPGPQVCSGSQKPLSLCLHWTVPQRRTLPIDWGAVSQCSLFHHDCTSKMIVENTLYDLNHGQPWLLRPKEDRMRQTKGQMGLQEQHSHPGTQRVVNDSSSPVLQGRLSSLIFSTASFRRHTQDLGDPFVGDPIRVSIWALGEQPGRQTEEPPLLWAVRSIHLLLGGGQGQSGR